MGISAYPFHLLPATSLHDDDPYGHENAVCCTGMKGTNRNGVSKRLGSTFSQIGSKGVNQDSAILMQGYGIEDGFFCGVFDGHGKHGHIVSKIVRDKLPSLLLRHRNIIAKIISLSDQNARKNEKVDCDRVGPGKNFLNWKEACMSAFKVINKEIKLLDSLDCSCSGTTATVVVKHGKDLIMANLGDSWAVLGTRTENGIVAIQLTTDLKPGVPCEAERIRKCNGRVLALKEEPHIQRVWLPNENSPGLAMSSAFGDFLLKNHGIIAIPDVSYQQLDEKDEFLVLASDGVWDVLSNDEVISIVASTVDEERAAEAVVDAARDSWNKRFQNSKRDDCTVICLSLKQTKNVG